VGAKRDDAAALEAAVGAADEVLALIDTAALAAALGVPNLDPDDKKAKQQREVEESKKKALVAALHLKATAIADLHKIAAAKIAAAGFTADGEAMGGGGTDAAEKVALERLDAAVSALHAWAAPADHWKLLVEWHRKHGRRASAVQALDEHLGKEKGPAPKDKLELRIELLAGLGWSHWVANGKALLALKYPAAFPPPFNLPA